MYGALQDKTGGSAGSLFAACAACLLHRMDKTATSRRLLLLMFKVKLREGVSEGEREREGVLKTLEGVKRK